jgi:putative transcriptional regulator
MSSRPELIEQVRQLLFSTGFAVSERCSLRPISFDMVARRDNRLLVVKVLGNADALGERVARELRVLATFLDAAPLLVAQRSGAGELEDGVLYNHRGIPVVTLGTLRGHLTENAAPVAYASPGGLFVNLRQDALRVLRMQRALSLGVLAQVAGVSRRAIQMYEEGMHATIEAALRLEDYLQESLVEPIDPFRAFEPPAEGEAPAAESPARIVSEFEQAIHQMLRGVGFRVVPTQQSPFSALTQKPETTILTGMERKDATDETRARILASVRLVTETKAMYVVGRETTKTNLQGTPVVQRRELEKLRDPDELFDLLEERRKEPTST